MDYLWFQWDPLNSILYFISTAKSKGSSESSTGSPSPLSSSSTHSLPSSPSSSSPSAAAAAASHRGGSNHVFGYYDFSKQINKSPNFQMSILPIPTDTLPSLNSIFFPSKRGFSRSFQVRLLRFENVSELSSRFYQGFPLTLNDFPLF